MYGSEKHTAESGVTLKFDAGKLPKTGKRKARDCDHSGQNRDTGRVPRISRLMALAIHIQKLIDNGAVRDYAEIARVTQIMNLTLLAPEIQEQILFLPRIENGHDPIAERNIRKITAELAWAMQKLLWEEVNLEQNCGGIAHDGVGLNAPHDGCSSILPQFEAASSPAPEGSLAPADDSRSRFRPTSPFSATVSRRYALNEQ